MKKYNTKINKIEELPKTLTIDGVVKYTGKMSDSEFISNGYLPVVYHQYPNRRYYTAEETKEIIDNVYTISYIPVERNIEEVKSLMLKDLKQAFLDYADRPRVDTGLGYFVDGARMDRENFEIGKKYALPQVKDADGNMQNVIINDYDTILTAIEMHGISLMITKWDKQLEIEAMGSIAECILYEATPYEVEEEVIDELTMEPTGEIQIVTKYRNNIKEWF